MTAGTTIVFFPENSLGPPRVPGKNGERDGQLDRPAGPRVAGWGVVACGPGALQLSDRTPFSRRANSVWPSGTNVTGPGATDGRDSDERISGRSQGSETAEQRPQALAGRDVLTAQRDVDWSGDLSPCVCRVGRVVCFGDKNTPGIGGAHVSGQQQKSRGQKSPPQRSTARRDPRLANGCPRCRFSAPPSWCPARPASWFLEMKASRTSEFLSSCCVVLNPRSGATPRPSARIGTAWHGPAAQMDSVAASMTTTTGLGLRRGRPETTRDKVASLVRSIVAIRVVFNVDRFLFFLKILESVEVMDRSCAHSHSVTRQEKGKRNENGASVCACATEQRWVTRTWMSCCIPNWESS